MKKPIVPAITNMIALLQCRIVYTDHRCYLSGEFDEVLKNGWFFKIETSPLDAFQWLFERTEEGATEYYRLAGPRAQELK